MPQLDGNQSDDVQLMTSFACWMRRSGTMHSRIEGEVDRKRTAWKKSRKFGDVKGGRTAPKITDGILRRAHSVQPPGALDSLPIYMVDNPSRDFFFPLNVDDIKHELAHLPKRDWSDITHIWLRRVRKRDYEAQEVPLAEFVCGSGVRMIVLYPWPRDMLLYIGESPPKPQQIKLYAKYAQSIVTSKRGYFLEWTLPALKDFCVEVLLYHEIGHNADWYRRHWSKASARATEEFADQYAYARTSMRSIRHRGSD